MSITEPRADDWITVNQRLLDDEFNRLAARVAGSEPPAAADRPDGASTLDRIANAFGLSTFERGLLALCAGMELHCGLTEAVAGHGGVVSWALAQHVLPDPHWSALSPGGALRRWHLVELTAGRLAHAPLQASERVVHYLVGIDELDPLITGLASRLRPPNLMAESHAAQAAHIASCWPEPPTPWQPVVLHGEDEHGRLDVAWAASTALGLQPFMIHSADLPAAADERAQLASIWTRDALLSGAALIIETDETTPARQLASWLSRVDGPVLVSSRHPTAIPGAAQHEVQRPEQAEQRDLWRTALGQLDATNRDLHPDADLLAATRRLSAREIHDCARLHAETGNTSDLGAVLRRQLRRPDLDGIVRVIRPAATWSELVLPEDRIEVLRALADQVRTRTVVHTEWGFAERNSRGLGTTALFAGEPGTGKTMAAEVIATELGLDLLHVDLSAVVSKYIGETEKNLRRIFDGAEQIGAILLFDEADALFGKRSEVRDSHDRYANIEISYLLQRMEAYRGLALLTTNARSSLDHAFVRRLGFVVQFPFPDRQLRRRIWANAFPERTPTADLDPQVLSSLAVSGGAIRNIALAAAFRAAAAGEPVDMTHIAWAARTELAKSDTTASPSDFAGWDT